MIIEGLLSARILILTSQAGINERAEKLVVAGHNRETLLNTLRRVGLTSADYCLLYATDTAEIEARVKESMANVIVTMDDKVLQILTGLDSSDKQHCSVLLTTATFGKRKVIPVLPLARIMKKYSDVAYLTVGFMKAKVESATPEYLVPDRTFVLAENYQTAVQYLQDCVVKAPELALDIENSNGQINCVGFATSPTEAVAIRTTMDCYSKEDYFKLWKLMASVIESNVPKFLQNFIHEQMYFSAYGIYQRNVSHDTMICMKFLHPEFEMGLHNVGRLYTPYPYWKDDNDDWNNVQDWERHLTYNCKDTTATFAATIAQRLALKDRGLWDLYYNYQHRFNGPITEMCTNGLLLDPVEHARQREEALTKIQHHQQNITAAFSSKLNRVVNTRSPLQMKNALKDMGFKMFTKRDKKTGNEKETADKKALIKMARKYPKETLFKELIELTKLNKQFSSYIDFGYDQKNSKVRYSINGHGTETGRWSCYTDAWGKGFNAQTIPKKSRGMFIAAPGCSLIQIDLAQAESRYVAYESPEPELIRMLENREDVHKYVAAKIFHKEAGLVNDKERQLGKKSGHAANYGVGANTFAEAALVENDIFLTKQDAQRIINGYFMTFPGIAKRQQRIQQQIRNTKTLKTPIGRERIFYDRIGDTVFREAYAYCPQSVIPDITNHLMLFLYDNFEDLDFIIQVHDSLLLQYPTERCEEIVLAARDSDAWHPKIILPGGQLTIPVDIEIGQRWNKLEKIP